MVLSTWEALKQWHKIIDTIETLGINRFMIHTPVGSMPHECVMHSIRLLGKKLNL